MVTRAEQATAAERKAERGRLLEALNGEPLPLPTEPRLEAIAYSDDLPAEAEALGRHGLSEVETASHWGISASTLGEWADGHVELAQALMRARTHEEAWWEEQIRRAIVLNNNRFPAGAWAIVMRSRFNRYRERVDHTLTVDFTKRLVLVDARSADLPSQQTVEGAKPLTSQDSTRLAASQTGGSSLVIQGEARVIDGGDGALGESEAPPGKNPRPGRA
jgi:hypothetical protein